MDESIHVLNNKTRQMLYKHIVANPGVSFIILKKAFNLNDSTLRYHLKYLEKNEKISQGVEKGKRNYYPHKDNAHVYPNREEVDNDTLETLEPYELTLVQEKLINIIRKYPGINQKGIIRRTGLNRITVSRNLKKLIDICVVRKLPSGNSTTYEYIENAQLRYYIMKRLLVKLLKKELDEESFLKLKRSLD